MGHNGRIFSSGETGGKTADKESADVVASMHLSTIHEEGPISFGRHWHHHTFSWLVFSNNEFLHLEWLELVYIRVAVGKVQNEGRRQMAQPQNDEIEVASTHRHFLSPTHSRNRAPSKPFFISFYLIERRGVGSRSEQVC